MNVSIFKAYDIRGVSPGELDEDTAYRVGQALVKLTEAGTVVVGKDMRETTPALFEAFANGVNSLGADVVDVGMMTTPMFYFAVGWGPALVSGTSGKKHVGAMITASHNPARYNGIKLCDGDVLPIGAESGMPELRDLALAGPYPPTKTGVVAAADVRGEYLDRLFSMVSAKKFAPLSVVVDCGNGMEGAIIGDILARMPQIGFYGLYLEPDGRFPNHEANPLKEETLNDLKAKVAELGADVGFAFDGDGDRIGLVDEKGRTVPGDIIMALLSSELLAGAPGAAVIYDLRCSWTVAEEVAKAGGRPVMSRVGHGFIKPLMRKEGAVFAGELSDHFYFRDMYGSESSDLVMLLVLQRMSETGKKLSELVESLMRYAHSGELNFEVEDKAAAIARIRAAYAHEASEVTEIDGLRLEFRNETRPEGDWWFSLRQSNTEPLLRLNVEARGKTTMEEKRDELVAIIKGGA